MKRILISLCILSSTTLCPGQIARNGASSAKNPDLSGTWTLDISKSELGQPRRELVYDDLPLIILQNDLDLKITRKVVKNKKERFQELIYYTDGRGESNPGIDSNDTIKSKTKWAGDILISESVHRVVGAGAVISFETTDRWQLSDNGQTLVYTRSSSTLRKEFGAGAVLGRVYPIKRVFRKAP
jgi:hypothetical protein